MIIVLENLLKKLFTMLMSQRIATKVRMYVITQRVGRPRFARFKVRYRCCQFSLMIVEILWLAHQDDITPLWYVCYVLHNCGICWNFFKCLDTSSKHPRYHLTFCQLKTLLHSSHCIHLYLHVPIFQCAVLQIAVETNTDIHWQRAGFVHCLKEKLK